MRWIAMILCGIIVSLSSWADDNDYKAPAMYDLQGSVKEFKIKTKNAYVYGKKWRFGKNGKVEGFYYYNEKGLPTKSELTYGNHGTSFYIEYNAAEKPVKLTYNNTFCGNYTCEQLISYEGNRRCKEIITEGNGKKQTRVTLTYSDEKFDDRGNWISRTAHETKTDSKGKTKERTYPETRTITYY